MSCAARPGLQQLAVTVAGVHLQSEGGLHATLDHALIHLDPLHVTGEETDLRAQGSLSLKDKHATGLCRQRSDQFENGRDAGPRPDRQRKHHLPGGGARSADESRPARPHRLPERLAGARRHAQRPEPVAWNSRVQPEPAGGQVADRHERRRTVERAGYLAYQHGIFADLTATGAGIRIRYPQGSAPWPTPRFICKGSQNNLLLSGDVLITRFTLSPDLDMAALAAQANAVETIAPPDAPSNHIRLDVHIVSSPQLNFQNAYAKLAGNVDLRLRGTVASPSLLGRVSITEGSAIIAGTRYELQRGDINFTNPVRIEPNIDLNATARVEDYDITLGLHGTPEKMAVTYRSDPPLPEADVVALLALGRTESQQRLYTQQQQQSLSNPTTDALLGGALNATVSTPRAKALRRGIRQGGPQLPGRSGQLHLPHHRRGAGGPRPHSHLRHQRQHHRPAAHPGRSSHQPPCLPADGPRRVRRLLRGAKSHPPLQVSGQGSGNRDQGSGKALGGPSFPRSHRGKGGKPRTSTPALRNLSRKSVSIPANGRPLAIGSRETNPGLPQESAAAANDRVCYTRRNENHDLDDEQSPRRAAGGDAHSSNSEHFPRLPLAPGRAQTSGAAASAQTDNPASSAAAARLNKKQFSNVKVSVEHGIATLTGTVDLYEYKADAEKRVRKAKGVTAVRNLIEVAGPSRSRPGTAGQAGREAGLRSRRLRQRLQLHHHQRRKRRGDRGRPCPHRCGQGLCAGSGLAPIPASRMWSTRSRSIPSPSWTIGIRMAVARAVYGYPTLNKYAIDPAKPIRISVQNGHVELYGMVDSQADKDIAFMRANGVPGVFSVKNYLQVAGQPSEAEK